MFEEIKSALESEDTPASVLLVIAVDLLTDECFSYEPEVIIDSLEHVYHVKLPEDNVDKLMAIQSAYTSNAFFMSLPVFLATVDALNNNGTDFNYVDIPEAKEVALAVTEVLMNLPDEDTETLFHPDIEVFIKTLLKTEGYTKVPDSLGFIDALDVPSIDGTFMDDPEFYSAYDQMRTDDAVSLDSYVTDHISKIIMMCNNLPLRNKNAESWGSFTKSSVG